MSKKSRSPQARMYRTCRKKKVYDTEADCADDVFKYFTCNKFYLKPYQCDTCGKFHLTSKDAKAEIYQIAALAMIAAKNPEVSEYFKEQTK